MSLRRLQIVLQQLAIIDVRSDNSLD